jgi:hypothetical protein
LKEYPWRRPRNTLRKKEREATTQMKLKKGSAIKAGNNSNREEAKK